MPYNLQSIMVVIKNITLKIVFLIILTACGLESHDNANAPVNIANYALVNCPIPSSSAAYTAEYEQSSGLVAICASYAYDAGYTGEGQTVSLLDTPVFTDHAEFIDDNGNSAFATGNNASCSHTCSNNNTHHGTHVAGIIGARKNTLASSSNMHGVAYNSKIKAIAIFDEAGNDNGNAQTLVRAINQGSGATIIAMNNSWGTEIASCVNYQSKNYYYIRPPGKDFNDESCTSVNFTPRNIELNAWKDAVNSGTIVVFANGNHGLNSTNGKVALYNNADFSRDAEPDQIINASALFGASNANITSYEAMYPEYDGALKGKWLNVIAVDSNNNITSFSNGCGVTKDYCIAAPGYNILGPIEPQLWGYISGTSQAAPYVSGAIAVLKEAYPSMSSEEIVELILESADDLGAPGTDNVYGRGMLNLRAAIQPIGEVTAVTTDNQSFGVPMNDTSITLASHFGTQIHDIEIGMRDNYNRTFITSPTKFDREPISVTLDDYMQNFTNTNQIETYELTSQATLNYQAQENGAWVNLIYDYGNTTASVAFHDNLQPQILPNDDDRNGNNKTQNSQKLRAFAIRPAGKDIAQMNIAHRLNQSLTLSNYAAKGMYDTGHDFNELGTDITYQNKRMAISIGVGHLREYQQFLGTQGTGAYALDGATLSQFSDINISHKLHKNSRFSAFAQYTLYQTDVDMHYQQFAEIADLQADNSKIGITGADIISDDDNLTISLNTQLGVTDGALVQHTVLGYHDDGSYNNVSNRYDLAVGNRHQQLSISYQGKLQNRGERNIPLFLQNRFFTTITIDKHYQHQQDLTQISIISGINTEF